MKPLGASAPLARTLRALAPALPAALLAGLALRRRPVFGGALLALLAVYCAALGWYFPRAARAARWDATGGVLFYRRGLLLRRETLLRLADAKAACRTRTPLQRALGLCTVLLYPESGRALRLADLSNEDGAALLQEWGRLHG